MDTVITNLNRVFFVGGAEDMDLQYHSEKLLEWNLVTNRVNRKADMLQGQVDFGSCFLNMHIYVVGGWVGDLLHTSHESTQRYSIEQDKWQRLPRIEGLG